MSGAEVALTVGGIVFSLLVLPTLLDESASVPRAQSVPTAGVMVAFFAVPYTMLGLVWPAVSAAVGGVLWGLVAAYRAPETNPQQTTSSTVNRKRAD